MLPKRGSHLRGRHRVKAGRVDAQRKCQVSMAAFEPKLRGSAVLTDACWDRDTVTQPSP